MNKNHKNNMIRFLLPTFFFTWLLWLPGILATHTSLSIPEKIIFPLLILGTFMPSLFGIIFAKKEKQQGLFRKWFNVRLGWYWLPVILLLPLGGVGAQLLNRVVSGVPFPKMPNLLILPAQFIGILLISGPINEEFGWRGYALGKLQAKYNALTSSLVIGMIWVVWHVPVFFIEGAPQSRMPFIQFSITLMAASVLMTWAQNNTRQSLWPALIIHTTINFTNELFPLINMETNNYTPWIYANVILVMMALIITLLYGADTLSKKIQEKDSSLRQ